MSKTIIRYFFLFIIMILAQVIIFNNLCLFNVAIPIVFIYFIIKLPITLSANWVLTLSFIIGFCIDIFSDTHGMHSLACSIIAMMRRNILRLYFQREDDLTNPEPSIHSLGIGVYTKYVFTIVLLYNTLIFLIESFSIFNLGLLILRIIASTLLTFLLIIGIDSLTIQRREKRL